MDMLRVLPEVPQVGNAPLKEVLLMERETMNIGIFSLVLSVLLLRVEDLRLSVALKDHASEKML